MSSQSLNSARIGICLCLSLVFGVICLAQNISVKDAQQDDHLVAVDKDIAAEKADIIALHEQLASQDKAITRDEGIAAGAFGLLGVLGITIKTKRRME